jgi:hypothetical protein
LLVDLILVAFTLHVFLLTLVRVSAAVPNSVPRANSYSIVMWS